MNIKIAFVFLAILALSFVGAAGQVVSEAPAPMDPVQVAPNDPSVQFNLVSPNGSSRLETMNTLNVEFNFVARAYDFHDGSYISSCYITLSNGDVLETVLNGATGVGTAQYSLTPGDYSWTVTCNSNNGGVWTSNAVDFAVRIPVAQVELGEPSIVVNNPSTSNDDDNDNGNGRRRAGTGLPLTPLSTTPGSQSSQNSEDSSSNEFSGITGAVVGLFGGEKNAKIAGILIVVLGLAGLVVYNREYLGLVKA